jgi:Tol biopolymer transport system component
MRIDRLDRAVAAAIAATVVLALIVLSRGDQVGVRIALTQPADGAVEIGLRPVIGLTFSEQMLPLALEGRLSFSPPVTGTLRWSRNSALFTPAAPLAADTVYTLTIRSGAPSARGRLTRDDVIVRFVTHRPRLVYLAPATGISDLVLADVGGPGQERRLTSEPFGVYDFAVSPDGRRIAFSANRDSGGSRDLYLVGVDGSDRKRIVTCDQQHCQSPSWSADGARIAFERRNLEKGAIGVVPGASRPFVYDAVSGQASALFTDTQYVASSPRWSTAGETLSYYDTIQSILTVLDMASGTIVEVPSVLGDAPVWAPDGRSFLLSDLMSGDGGRFQQLLRFDYASVTLTPVMPYTDSNDYGAAWSPYGDEIVFGRQSAELFSATSGAAFFGPQVWVVGADGLTPRALTTDTEYSHAGMSWSPDGRWISLVRTNLRTINPIPEVWLIRPDGSGARSVARDATLPAWVP